MRVRLGTFLLWYGKPFQAGEEIDLPDDVAMRYIATHQAERVEQPQPVAPVIEAATVNRTIPNAALDRRPQQFKRR